MVLDCTPSFVDRVGQHSSSSRRRPLFRGTAPGSGCSGRARVCFAAPKPGAPLPAVRRSVHQKSSDGRLRRDYEGGEIYITNRLSERRLGSGRYAPAFRLILRLKMLPCPSFVLHSGSSIIAKRLALSRRTHYLTTRGSRRSLLPAMRLVSRSSDEGIGRNDRTDYQKRAGTYSKLLPVCRLFYGIDTFYNDASTDPAISGDHGRQK